MFDSGDGLARNYVKSHGLRARDVMTRSVVTVDEGASLEKIAEVLESKHIKRVPVLRDDALVEIVSRADFLRGLAAESTPGILSVNDQVTVMSDALRSTIRAF